MKLFVHIYNGVFCVFEFRLLIYTKTSLREHTNLFHLFRQLEDEVCENLTKVLIKHLTIRDRDDEH